MIDSIAHSSRIDCAQAMLLSLTNLESEADQINELVALERLIATATARRARVSVEFRASQLASQQAQGVHKSLLGKGIADQIALARRISPHAASHQIALVTAICQDLPRTMQLWMRGQIDERTATGVAKQVFCLDSPDRRAIDRLLADGLGEMSAKRAEQAARGAAARRCPEAIAARARKAPNERRVTIRPSEDMMVYLTALLPVGEGVATYAALDKIARDRLPGEERSRGQLMADALFQRVTGYRSVDQIPLQVILTMPAQTLVSAGAGPGRIGGSVVPAEIARELLIRATAEQKVAVRRLFTDPCTGNAQNIDSSSRTFDGVLREFVGARDQFCRTPYCEAPIRHVDHVVRHADGGPTNAMNAQGLCERCNYAKEAPGWRHNVAAPRSGIDHTVIITTQTGHVYRSQSPPVLDKPLLARSTQSPMERRISDRVAAALTASI